MHMRGALLALALAGLAGSSLVRADGLLIPTDRELPPLSLSYERIDVTVVGQVATTRVAQSYHNSTDGDLEAEYIFPLPAGSSVRDFSMQVGGQTYRGASVAARDARRIYEDIVRRLKDPGLLEYLGGDLWKVRIYPVPRHGEQKIEITFTSILPLDGDMVSYQYLLRTGQTVRSTVKDFTMVVRIKSEEPLGPIYSPSHDVAIDRRSEQEAVVSFEQNAAVLDKDFQLYFSPSSQQIGFSFLTQRESPGQGGFFLLLLSPRNLSDTRPIPRDLVVVVDTSSSMGQDKLSQAKAAMIHAIDSLAPCDRFGLIAFATTPSSFRPELSPSTDLERTAARNWVENLKAVGGTDISAALEAAVALRNEQTSHRTFQIVFITDGQPTVGETDSAKILESVLRSQLQNHGQSVRIHTFGIGDDVDAHLLDSLAEATRGSSAYVRRGESLEAKVSALAARIKRPVRTDLSLFVKGSPRIAEMYPPQLPDLYQGEQLQLVGRYERHGRANLTLKGFTGDGDVSESFDVDFPERAFEHDFIAPIWAGRKVGYLLDKIRLGGESPALKRELIRVAHDFSIATPYTSLLVVPEPVAPAELNRTRANSRRTSRPTSGPVMAGGMGGGGGGMGGPRSGMGSMAGMFGGIGGMPGMGGGMGGMAGMGAGMGGMGNGPRAGTGLMQGDLAAAGDNGARPITSEPGALAAHESSRLGERSRTEATASAPLDDGATSGTAAIDLAQRLAELKREARTRASLTSRTIAGRRFRKLGDAWVDEGYRPNMPSVRVRLLGTTYFGLLACHPELGQIFGLGNDVTWVSPSGTALIVSKNGPDQIDNPRLDRLWRKGDKSN
jgi:Ca-activated chloride channel homolog